MRFERDRAKKLIVAFHFHLSSQAGWRCDECRRHGLESKRHCGWQNAERGRRIVWMRRHAKTDCCPKSEVTGQSLSWLEEFAAWKSIGGAVLYDLPAKTVDAFCLLENELRLEREHGS